MNKDHGKILTAFLAVLFGVFAIIQFVPDVELVVGFLSLTFGILAIIWTIRARCSLSPGTSLRDYATYFLLSLLLIVAFSVWDTLILLFDMKGAAIYPKYVLITLAYLVFVFASYNILCLGKQFGFKPQVARMNLKQKKR